MRTITGTCKKCWQSSHGASSESHFEAARWVIFLCWRCTGSGLSGVEFVKDKLTKEPATREASPVFLSERHNNEDKH